MYCTVLILFHSCKTDPYSGSNVLYCTTIYCFSFVYEDLKPVQFFLNPLYNVLYYNILFYYRSYFSKNCTALYSTILNCTISVPFLQYRPVQWFLKPLYFEVPQRAPGPIFIGREWIFRSVLRIYDYFSKHGNNCK